MQPNQSNRRKFMSQAGALAVSAGAPMIMSAGGILVPRTANALTLSQSNQVYATRTIDGVATKFYHWKYSDGRRLTFATANGTTIGSVYRHLVNGVWVHSKYKGGTFNSTEGAYTFPSTHAHRHLEAHHLRDVDGNGSLDYRLGLSFPAGRTDLLYFDSRSAWQRSGEGVDFLVFRRYSLNGTTYVQGELKDINSSLVNQWYTFNLSGSKEVTFMDKFNAMNNQYKAMESVHTAALAATAVGVALFVAGGGLLCVSVAAAGAALYPAVIGTMAIGATTALTGSIGWINHATAQEKVHTSMSALEAYVAQNNTGLTRV